MKFITGLLAFAVALAVGAADVFFTDTEAQQGVYYLRCQEFAKLDNATRHSELERISSIVKEKGTLQAKQVYAMLTAALFANETESVTLEQVEAKFDEAFNASNPPATLPQDIQDRQLSGKLCAINGAYVGPTTQEKLKSLEKAAYDKYKNGLGKNAKLQFVWLAYDVNQNIEETKALLTEDDYPATRHSFMKLAFYAKKIEYAAPCFWEYLLKGELLPTDGQYFSQVLAYELEQENFDAAALKSKLTRAILVYRAKARQWKPSKEGESNPFIEFVGMMQDTAKDL